MSESRIPISTPAGAASKMQQRPSRKLRMSELSLRALAAITCLVTLLVLVTDKQTKIISIPGLPGLAITKTAKYNLSKAFVYLVCASGIAAAHATLMGVLTVFLRPSGGTNLAWLVFVLDQLVTYMLLAAASASTEVAYLGNHASPDAAWLKVCTIFGRFCNQLGASLVASFIATVVFAFLTTISAYHVFHRTDYGFENSHKGSCLLSHYRAWWSRQSLWCSASVHKSMMMSTPFSHSGTPLSC